MPRATQTRGEHAARWLVKFLTAAGGEAPRPDIIAAAAAAGIRVRTLYRVLDHAGVVPAHRWRLNGGRHRCPHCGGAL